MKPEIMNQELRWALENNKNVVIFDLDGTMCDAEHRRRYVATEPKNWDAFNKACVLDNPNQHVLDFYDVLAMDGRFNIVFFSGRSAQYWDETVAWLEKYVLNYSQVSVEKRLFMRGENDRRPDTIVKKEMLDVLRSLDCKVRFAVDDRNCVVDFFRSEGVPVFQCNPGDF